jgi:hypothetical protein
MAMTQEDAQRPDQVKGRALRDGMSTDEMVARLASLNGIDTEDSAAQFEDVDATYPQLRAATIGEAMFSASHGSNENPMGFHNQVFLADWLESHDLLRHSGYTYRSAWSATFGDAQLFRYLATMLRLRKNRDLLELATRMRLVEASLTNAVRHSPRFDSLTDHVRAFADPAHPTTLAGIAMTPYLAWDWELLEAFTAFLRDAGLEVRIGLSEDQWYNGSTTPIVIWNPAMVEVSRVETLASLLEEVGI